MKRVNAQWVFLIILMLWIPALCFGGYEVDGVMYSGPPIPEPVESGLTFLIWYWGVATAWFAGGIFCAGLTYVALHHSMKFNYHLYVTHGTFAFWVVDDDSETWKKRKEIGLKLKYIDKKATDGAASADVMFLAWWPACLVMLFCWAVVAIGGFLWPLVLLVFLPFFAIQAIARKRRRKVVFVDKLKDKETNGLV